MVDNSLNICYNINATTENDAFKAHRKPSEDESEGFLFYFFFSDVVPG